MLDEDRQQLHLEFYDGIPEDMVRLVEWIEMGQAICGTVAQQRCQIVQSNIQHSTDPLAQLLKNLGLTACACQPLISQGHLFGTLAFGSRSRTHFTTTEVRLFQAISDQFAIALERAGLISSLRQQTEELTHLNRLKDEFLAALSHELRTPLSPILGWTQLMKEQKLPPAKTAEALEIIERNIKQQIAIVSDLLDVSRVIQGKMHLTLEPVDLTVIVNHAIETVQFTAQAKWIEIEVQNPLPLPVSGDSARLQQVFWNLLTNAIKFTPEAGKIAIDLSIFVNESSANYAQVRVTDNGIGIQPDFLPYVFDHFRQADGSPTRKYGGLGLGLSIVRHLVELHGGKVTVESPGEGQGATFMVRLPLLTAAQASDREVALLERAIAFAPPPELSQDNLPPLEPLPQPPTVALNGVQILFVDDDRDNLDLMGFLLQEYGAIVTTLTSAIEALDLIPTHPPDLIISDIGTPKINGCDFIRRVRALPIGREIPALALSALGQQKDQDEALQIGFQAYLTKPVDPLELLSVLMELVR